MLIKKITMHNFRQYIDENVEFSTDTEKNITLVMGDNGTGKTTLAQAFLWCLYADTDFEIKEIINRKVRDKLPPGGTTSASVSLEVNYNDIDYTIERTQTFRKVQTKVNGERPELRVYYKKEGNLTYLKEAERYILIKNMLPQQLSRFFFFDGERIRIMSDEINHGKSREFKEAVAGLVGLTSMQNAIQHLKPSNTASTVIGYYRKKIDESGDAKVKEYTEKIEKTNSSLANLYRRVEEIEPQIDSYEKEAVNLKATILNSEPEMELKQKHKDLERELNGLNARRIEKIDKGILSRFGKNFYNFVTAVLAEKVKPEIDNIKEAEADIPIGIEVSTLAYMLKRGRCVCGEPLEPGDPHFKTISDLMEFAPPKTTGKYVQEIKDKNKDIIKNKNGVFDNFSEQIKDYFSLNERIEITQQKATDLFNRLADTTEGEKAKAKLETVEFEKKRLSDELIDKKGSIQAFEQDIHRWGVERDKLVHIDADNKRYIRYLAYAEQLYSAFSNRYDYLERKTRIKLEDKINEIFPEIYEGGMRIEVDDKYNIKVLVDDAELSEDEIEKNTAQSYSVIFSFISSIIAMAKEKSLADENMSEAEKDIFSEAEGYPLVMDAPLSNFDKTRIQQICTIIPSIAKQVVFFIKDTDGEVAEAHMRNKIGRKYIINTDDGSKTRSTITEV